MYLMYIYTYIHMYVCMYVRMYVYTCMHGPVLPVVLDIYEVIGLHIVNEYIHAVSMSFEGGYD